MSTPAIDEKNTLQEFLRSHLGERLHLEPLVGLGFGRVYELKRGDLSQIVKWTPEKREKLFYESIRPKLVEQGLDVPELLESFSFQKKDVLVLEKIEELLPESRWRIDEGVLQYLSKLHQMKIELPDEISSQKSWEEAHDGVVARHLSGCESKISELKQKYDSVFREREFISGDPSGRNWGVRGERLSLFDWERFGVSSPAVDLAAVAFGEGDDAFFKALASAYLDCRQDYPKRADLFAGEIQFARVWLNVQMFLESDQGISPLPDRLIERMERTLPDWIRSLT